MDAQCLGGKLRELKMKICTVRGMEIAVCQLILHAIHENLMCATVRQAGATAAFPKSCLERGSDSRSARLKLIRRESSSYRKENVIISARNNKVQRSKSNQKASELVVPTQFSCEAPSETFNCSQQRREGGRGGGRDRGTENDGTERKRGRRTSNGTRGRDGTAARLQSRHGLGVERTPANMEKKTRVATLTHCTRARAK